MTPKAIVTLFALLTASQSAKAVEPGCVPLNACQHIVYCAYIQLDSTNYTDRTNLLSGLERDNGSDIKDATDKCQTHYGHHDSYVADFQGCDAEQANQIGRHAKKTHCASMFQPPPPPPGPVDYCETQGKYYELGKLGPPGYGICELEVDPKYCHCGESYGQTHRGH
jgi:hypothetical protein